MKTFVVGAFLISLVMTQERASSVPAPEKGHEVFELEELRRSAEQGERLWSPFLERASLQTGLYRLAAGGEDHQTPHELDEVYFVTRGRARFQVEGAEYDAASGSIFYVAAGLPHRFFDITADLEVLVFFSKKRAEK